MTLEELVENLVFSATYPRTSKMLVVTVDVKPLIEAYNWAVDRLTERYGRLEFRRTVLLLELSETIAELRREVSKAMSKQFGYALTDSDEEGQCKVMLSQ